MEYKKIEFNNYNLHLMKTNKFKTISVDLVFRKEIEKKDITYRNLLNTILNMATGTLKTKREINIKKADLYDLQLENDNHIIGNFILDSFKINFLEEKYSELTLPEEAIGFLNEIVFNPYITDSSFDADIFKMAVAIEKERIAAANDNKILLSLNNMFEKAAPDNPVSINKAGYLEDLEKITPTSLYNYYTDMMNGDLVDIYVLGNIDFHQYEEIINNNIMFINSKNYEENLLADFQTVRKRSKTIKEEDNINQSKLSILLKTEDISDYERNYVMPLYNAILGGTLSSKLFNIVREKHSLCYYISSALLKYNGGMYIYSGISKKNFDKTIKLIKKILKDMENSDISIEEFDSARANIKTNLDKQLDSEEGIISSKYLEGYYHIDPLELRKEIIDEVKLSELANFSKKVFVDTIYLLEGAE